MVSDLFFYLQIACQDIGLTNGSGNKWCTSSCCFVVHTRRVTWTFQAKYPEDTSFTDEFNGFQVDRFDPGAANLTRDSWVDQFDQFDLELPIWPVLPGVAI